MAKENKKSFEKALSKLQDITIKMEQDELNLEQSMKLYKKGIEEANFCLEFLNDIEQEVKVLQKNSDGTFKLTKFESLEEY